MPTHEKAIAAYQFQVERYHTWMNYYSLFNGALLVAVYSLFDKEKESPFLLLILSIVGFVAGLCWLGSIVGNRYWMNSWLQIVKQETTVSSKSMYSSYYCKEGEEKYFLSTPVLTQLFISTVVLAWGAYILYIAHAYWNLLWLATVGIVAVFLLALLLLFKKKTFIHSDLSGMTKISCYIAFLGVFVFSSCNSNNNNVEKTEEIKNNEVELVSSVPEPQVKDEDEEVTVKGTGLPELLEPQVEDDLYYHFAQYFFPVEGFIDGLNSPGLFKKLIEEVVSFHGVPFWGVKGLIAKISFIDKGCEICIKPVSARAQLDHLGRYYVCHVPEEQVLNFSIDDEVYCWASFLKLDTDNRCIICEAAVIGSTEKEVYNKVCDIKNSMEKDDIERLKYYLDVKIKDWRAESYGLKNNVIGLQSSTQRYKEFFAKSSYYK